MHILLRTVLDIRSRKPPINQQGSVHTEETEGMRRRRKGKGKGKERKPYTITELERNLVEISLTFFPLNLLLSIVGGLVFVFRLGLW